MATELSVDRQQVFDMTNGSGWGGGWEPMKPVERRESESEGTEQVSRVSQSVADWGESDEALDLPQRNRAAPAEPAIDSSVDPWTDNARRGDIGESETWRGDVSGWDQNDETSGDSRGRVPDPVADPPVRAPSPEPTSIADLEQAARTVLKQGELLWAVVDQHEARLPSGVRLTLTDAVGISGWWPVRVLDAASLRATAVQVQGASLTTWPVEEPEAFALENDASAKPTRDRLPASVQVGAGRFYVRRHVTAGIGIGALLLGLAIGFLF